jgi:hypothetical protein
MPEPAEIASLFDDSPIEPGSKPPSRPAPVPEPPVASMRCPNCGYEQADAAECLKCGVVVAKFRARQSAPQAGQSALPPPLPEVRSREEIQADLHGEGYVPRERVSDAASEHDGFFAPEKAGLDKGVVGGGVMMLIAVVWFAAGWAAGYIFFYPPVLFVIGLFGLVKGLLTGNVSG